MENNAQTRRSFLQNVGISAISGVSGIPQTGFANPKVDGNINHIGPKEGFTPLIGTLISMLDWISESVINYNLKLTVDQLDYIHDKESNTIGSLLLHVVATEVVYQDITFHNLQGFSDTNKNKWNVAMELGDEARTQIKVIH